MVSHEWINPQSERALPPDELPAKAEVVYCEPCQILADTQENEIPKDSPIKEGMRVTWKQNAPVPDDESSGS